MKYTTLVSLAVASSALAELFPDVPDCATGCFEGATEQASRCSASDLVCFCSLLASIQGAAAGCVLAACGKDVALSKVLPAIERLCPITHLGGGDSGGNAPILQPRNSVSVLPQPVTQPGGPRTTMTSLATTPAATGSPTRTASTSSPVSTAGAAVVGPVGGLAVLVAGGLVLL
ncbi:hypothetical protein E4U42_004371 [Claviceps africana]|uniref:CFEM domain-containing protein n=1 Tax=Claviceps africana TaxID=83212 RepID=A0A8K0J5T3_9HYPO|nr:hypothetical protein E4U42_004371 [Claviceps africana]